MSCLPADRQLNAPRYGSLYQMLTDWAERTPNSPAILAAGYAPLTYGGLRQQVDDAVRMLRAWGVGPRDRIAVVLPNGPEMAVACLAVAAGQTCAPLNPASRAQEFAFYLSALRPKALLIARGMASPARAVAQTLDIPVIELQGTCEPSAGLFTLTAGEGLPPGPVTFPAADEVALLVPTGGTTSHPKIVPLTHTNLCTAVHNLAIAFDLAADDRCLNVMPLYHVHALLTALLVSVAAGASTVCTPGFAVEQFFGWLEEFSPTWYTAVPTIHESIVAHAGGYAGIIARHPLRLIRAGSAALPGRVRADLEQIFGAQVIETYGMTEASGHITCNPPPRGRWRRGSAGAPVGPQVGIMDADGTLLPAGDRGEIVVRGPTVMQGYVDDPMTNQYAFVNGWFKSGDQGYLDADGYLYVTGRLKEIINRGGEKISPQEIEEVLAAHPAVAQAVAFGLTHPRLGEDVAAAVVLHPQAVTTEQDLRVFALQHLIAWKVPRQIAIVEALPTTSTGKLQRLGMADKLGLPHDDSEQPGRQEDYLAPRTPTEDLLAGLWAQIFKLDRVGVQADFFRLGGDSLLAMQLRSRIHGTWRVDLAFRDFFEAPSLGAMARRIEAARQPEPAGLDVPLQPVPREQPLPLSFAQQRLWFLEQLAPSRAVYNLPLAWRFRGQLQVEALEHSLRIIVQRHDILRTTFPAIDGQARQAVAPELEVPLVQVDLQTWAHDEHEAALQRWLSEAAQQPFDLARGPLVRATLLRMGETDHVLLLMLHHIIFDGWSLEVFWRELTALYSGIVEGQSAALPALPLQYADFAVWQRQRFQPQMLEASLAYWKQRLGADLPSLELPTDRPRPPIQSFRGARHTLVLPAALSTALKSFSQQAGATLFMTLLAAFQTLLFRYSGQTDLVLGMPVAGRTRVETEGLLGFFVNTLILRTDLRGNPPFRVHLDRVRELTVQAYDHQDMPFEKLVEALQPARDLSRNPLVQVMVGLQPPTPGPMEWPGLSVQPLSVDAGTSKFDLTLSWQEAAAGFIATLEYNTDLFEASTTARLLEHFHILLRGIVADPDQRLSDLPLLTAVERQRLLATSNTPVDKAQADCLHTLFEAQAQRTPEAIAAVCGGQHLTYRSLNQQANQLAHALRGLGVGPEVCVGLCVPRALDMLVGILGILKAGGAYVPLEPDLPAGRLTSMLADADVKLVVTADNTPAELPPVEHVLCLKTERERLSRQSMKNPQWTVSPEHLAYVMYTSGSTGAPQGVMIEHRQVVAFLHDFEEIAPGGAGHIGTMVCPFSFDVSVWEIFSMLCFGGTLHVLSADTYLDPTQFAAYLRDQRVTSAYIPPALLLEVAETLERRGAPLPLARLLVGVEPIPQANLQRWRDLSPQIRIVNGYGPTETTVCATLYGFEAASEPERRTPIGRGLRGTDIYLIDAHMQPVPIGIPGELLIGGAGVARGYVNQPSLTAERFIPHPFSPVPGARLYKSGDIARYLPDGNLEFLGRRDGQVKIHGRRIELAEIEAALRQHPALQESAVVCEVGPGGAQHLAAYVVANRQPGPAPADLRAFLQEKLPTYMIPVLFAIIPELPRTPAGKVDRQALPAADLVQLVPPAIPVAPRTAVEKTLAAIWAEVLELAQVGVHDNFFELGGDSIRGIQVIARANRLGLQLTPTQLFQRQTISELAALAGLPAPSADDRQSASAPGRWAHRTPEMWLADLPAERRQHIETLYALSPLQQGMLFHSLDAPDSAIYQAQWSGMLEGDLEVGTLRRAWQHVLDRHQALRTAFYWRHGHAPVQVVWRQVDLPWEIYDWRQLSEDAQARQFEALALEERRRHLDLAHTPLMRLILIRLARNTYRCLWSLHHLIVDAWSLPILLQEVRQCYEALQSGREPQLPAPRPYEDYIVWLQQQDLGQAEAYWRRTLKGFHTPTALKVGHGRHHSPPAARHGAEREIQLSAETTAGLRAFAQAAHVSLNTLMQGVWAMLLSRYSGEQDVVFGAVVSTRPPHLPGSETMVGLLINTLPVRVCVDPAALLIPWLQRLQEEQAEARRYDYSRLVDVQGWSDVPRGLPLFDSLLVYENAPAWSSVQTADGHLDIRQTQVISHTHYPLSLVVHPGGQLGLRIKYQSGRFDMPTVTRMLGHLRILLENFLANPNQRLAGLLLISAAEEQPRLPAWHAATEPSPPALCVHHLFESQATGTPEAPAVVYNGQTMTYRELNRRANQLAHRLITLGVGPEVRVGLYVERSLAMVAAVLGVLKSGGAYVPLDPAWPSARLRHILQEAQVALIVTQPPLHPGLCQQSVQSLCLDPDWQLVGQESEANPITAVQPEHLAYVMYTSGSTGTPKGVAVEHRQLANYLHGIMPRLALPHPASFALVSPLATDLGHTMLFGALCSGGSVHVLSEVCSTDPQALAEYLQRWRVDCLKIVPAHLAALQAAAGTTALMPRRLLILGGDAARSAWVESLLRLAPNVAILNHYGPTETTVGVLTHRLSSDYDIAGGATLPLGQPLAQVQVYLLDEALQPVPMGLLGEVCIGGASVTRGYVQQPALTAERFIPHPFSQQPGARLYRTGDLARYRADGSLEFVGRVDQQVKIRGYRVELEEIEATLEHHPSIWQAVVVAPSDEAGDRRLVAYCVLRPGTADDQQGWRAFLREYLPAYMVPATFVVLDTLPLTAHGKVDRWALPAPEPILPLQHETFRAPHTPTEEIVAGLWTEVLGVDSIGLHDDFFALGGHSLTALQVMSRLGAVFQVALPLRTLFEAPTVAGLARCVDIARQQALGGSVPWRQPRPRTVPIPMTLNQEQLWRLDRLLPGAPFSNMPYAVRLTGDLDVGALEQSFKALIDRHEALRTTFTAKGGQLQQVIAPAMHLRLPVIDLRARPTAERQARLEGLMQAAALYPFDLERGPMLDVRLICLDQQEHVLLITMHHIISDGWSRGILLRELSALYNASCQGQPSPLPAMALQYADYAQWQRQWLDSEAAQAQLAYWRQQLRQPLPRLELPTDQPRHGELSLRTARYTFQLPAELCADLARVSRQAGTTLFMTLLAAFKAMLFRYTGQADLRLGTLVANRSWVGSEGVLGLFANLVVVRTDLAGDPSVRQILQRVRTTTLEAYAHQDLPFEHLVRRLTQEGNGPRSTLFQVMFDLQQTRAQLPRLTGLTVEPLETHAMDATPCELVISLHGTPHGLAGICLYRTGLFEAATIARLLRDFEHMLRCCSSQPERPLSSVRLTRIGKGED